MDTSSAQRGCVGLAVVELQVLTLGHCGLLNWMLASCPTRILGLGSSDKHATPGHPFTFAQRKAMVEAVYGKGTFSFVRLRDIRSTHRGEWCDYVLSSVRAIGLPEPTDYFAGSAIDARWYEPRFPRPEGEGAPDGPGFAWACPASGRTTRILDRSSTPFPGARDVRELVEMRDEEWRRYVPAAARDIVEREYPPALRIPLSGPLPPPGSVPVGTLHLGEVGGTVTELMDDGKWRPAATVEDEKAKDARERAALRRNRLARRDNT